MHGQAEGDKNIKNTDNYLSSANPLKHCRKKQSWATRTTHTACPQCVSPA